MRDVRSQQTWTASVCQLARDEVRCRGSSRRSSEIQNLWWAQLCRRIDLMLQTFRVQWSGRLVAGNSPSVAFEFAMSKSGRVCIQAGQPFLDPWYPWRKSCGGENKKASHTTAGAQSRMWILFGALELSSLPWRDPERGRHWLARAAMSAVHLSCGWSVDVQAWWCWALPAAACSMLPMPGVLGPRAINRTSTQNAPPPPFQSLHLLSSPTLFCNCTTAFHPF